MNFLLNHALVTDFRSIRGTVEIPLDAPVVLIHGQNGAGKTSLLSAVEMAATGHVDSLRRADEAYLKHLVHRGAQTARIALTMNGKARLGEWLFVDGKPSGQPVLDPLDARFFSERCYLAQATLGRLIEIYEKADQRSSEAPLTQFVKELLRLERLDALIDGLHPVGDVRNLRKLVPDYKHAEARQKALDADLATQEIRLKTLNVERDIATRNYRIELERLAEPGAVAPNGEDDQSVAPLLDGRADDAGLTTAASDKRRVQLLIAEWEAVSGSVLAEEDRAAMLRAVDDAQQARNEWRDSDGVRLVELFRRSRSVGLDAPEADDIEWAPLHASLLSQVRLGIERLAKRLQDHKACVEAIAKLDHDIQSSNEHIGLLEARIAALAGDPEGLVDALAKLVPHIHGNDCPVCHRDFTEMSDTPLTQHVTERLRGLRDRIDVLQRLTRERAERKTGAATMERARSDLQTRLMTPEHQSEAAGRHDALTSLLDVLEALAPAAAEGTRRREALRLAEQAAQRVAGQDRRTVALRDAVRELAERRGLPADAAERSIPDALGLLRQRIDEDEARLLGRQRARKAALEAKQALRVNHDTIDALDKDIKANKRQLSAVTDALKQANTHRESARQLCHAAVEARAAVIRQVFNDQLNHVWRELFTRMVPDEPFVPAFVIPDAAGGANAVNIDTVHRDGTRAGTPRLMLSAGNLNTAALTLFLALHLSMEKRLPLIVLDDPVQSMDEPHIAQFAALLRSLKARGRQILIAVHERSLFDYLSLELSPACDGDRLITVELSRSFTGKTQAVHRVWTWERDRAVA